MQKLDPGLTILIVLSIFAMLGGFGKASLPVLLLLCVALGIATRQGPPNRRP